ncbi:MAG: Flp pilus assembly complex ATPase component TadA [Firmicutes bacterium]|nr:Flp pilus assembly complex ATPase component TadA [Bacillota bacterium]
MSALSLTDRLALVTTPSPLSLRAAALQLQELTAGGVGPITCVVNRVPESTASEVAAQVKRVLEVESLEVANEDEDLLATALEKRCLFSRTYGKSAIVRSLDYLTQELAVSPRPAKSVSLLEKYRRRKRRRRNLRRRGDEEGTPLSSAAGVPALKSQLHQRIVQELLASQWDLSVPWEELSASQELRDEIRRLCLRELQGQEGALSEKARNNLIAELTDEILGLGPLEALLADDSVTEIMVNGSQQIYIETKGKLQKTPLTFASDMAVSQVIERIVGPLGRRIDESSPMVDARLPDGSRVNAIIPPLALNGPILTIRKFARQAFTVDDLIAMGSLNDAMAQFIQCCVLARKNIIIAGGTGSGKTTLLNVLSGFIPADERIVTIEDAAELRLMQEHVCRLEAKPANVEGKGEVTIRELVKNALRMRPDRIIVGECRSDEVIDMLQAMNTGHNGSLTTIHANSAQDCVSRLETMILLAGVDLPLRAIREQIASAIDVIIFQSRLKDGSRKVLTIAEVTGIEEGHVMLRELFRFQQTGYDEELGVQGDFVQTSSRSQTAADFLAMGLPWPAETRDSVSAR